MIDWILAEAVVVPLCVGVVCYATYKIAKLFAPHMEMKLKS